MKVHDNRVKHSIEIGSCKFGSVVETLDGVCIVSDRVDRDKYNVVAVRLNDGRCFTYRLSERVTILDAIVDITNKEVTEWNR